MERMNDRGQMLLIGAIVMAAAFLSLGIVLNGSLHTPSIAAEASDDVVGNELASVTETIDREVGRVLRRARSEHPDDISNQVTYIKNNASALETQLQQYYASKDIAISFGTVEVVQGRNVSGEFDNAGDTGSQIDDSQVRKLTIEPEPSPPPHPIVNVYLVDGAETYRLDIYDDEVVVYNTTTTEMNIGSCTLGTSIEVIEATTDGEDPCSPLTRVVDDDGSFDSVDIENGPAASGARFEYITNDTTVNGDIVQEVVYWVRINLVAHSPKVTYNGTIDVAPGEP